MNDVAKLALKYGVAGAVAIAMPLAAYYEGLRTRTYVDAISTTKPLTICYGETLNVKPGDVKTPAQCATMLQTRLTGFAVGVRQLVTRPITDNQLAAFTDFAYNVGLTNFARSSVLRKFNAGDTRGACEALMQWRYAGGVELTGLVRRRDSERDLCLKGVK